MHLYDIQKELLEILDKGYDEECIDMETGEINVAKFADKVTALNLAADEKIENIALYIKDLNNDIKELAEEEKALSARRKAKQNKIDWLKNYVANCMRGLGKEKFETARCNLSFRNADALTVINQDKLDKYLLSHDEYLRYKEPEINKAALKKAIKAGEEIPGVQLSSIAHLQVK